MKKRALLLILVLLLMLLWTLTGCAHLIGMLGVEEDYCHRHSHERTR